MNVPDLIKAVEAGQTKDKVEIQEKCFMNERIKELYESAHEEVVETNSDNGMSCTVLDLNPEKFAELIIRECGAVAYRAYWKNPESVKGRHIEEQIKKHFGVE